MGYWIENETDTEIAEDLWWGDSPADAMGDGTDNAIDAFTRDLGRLPTQAEYLAGVLFSFPRHLPTEAQEAQEWAVYKGAPWDLATEKAAALREAARTAYPSSDLQRLADAEGVVIILEAALERSKERVEAWRDFMVQNADKV